MSQKFSLSEKQKMVEYIIDPAKRNDSWHGKILLPCVFNFEDAVWVSRPALAAIYFVGDLVELAVRGIRSEDTNCIDEINTLLKTIPANLKEHVKNAIVEAQHNISANKKLPETYKEAVALIKLI